MAERKSFDPLQLMNTLLTANVVSNSFGSKTDEQKTANRVQQVEWLQVQAMLQQRQQHDELMAAQAEQLRLAQQEADRNAAFLWAQYLSTEAGKAYLQWEAKALRAVAVDTGYTQLWWSAWEQHRFQGPLSPKRTFAKPKFWPWVLAWIVIVFAASVFLLPAAGGEMNAAGRIWWLIVLFGLPAARGVFRWTAVETQRKSTRAEEQRVANEIAARAQERVERYGLPLVGESHTRYGRATSWEINGWRDVDRSVPLATAVTRFQDQARRTFPQPDQLPWVLGRLDMPRSPDDRFPALVNVVLSFMVAGDPDAAVEECERRMRAWAAQKPPEAWIVYRQLSGGVSQ